MRPSFKLLQRASGRGGTFPKVVNFQAKYHVDTYFMEEYAIIFNQNITFTPESGHFTFLIFSAKSGSVVIVIKNLKK